MTTNAANCLASAAPTAVTITLVIIFFHAVQPGERLVAKRILRLSLGLPFRCSIAGCLILLPLSSLILPGVGEKSALGRATGCLNELTPEDLRSRAQHAYPLDAKIPGFADLNSLPEVERVPQGLALVSENSSQIQGRT